MVGEDRGGCSGQSSTAVSTAGGRRGLGTPEPGRPGPGDQGRVWASALRSSVSVLVHQRKAPVHAEGTRRERLAGGLWEASSRSGETADEGQAVRDHPVVRCTHVPVGARLGPCAQRGTVAPSCTAETASHTHNSFSASPHTLGPRGCGHARRASISGRRSGWQVHALGHGHGVGVPW